MAADAVHLWLVGAALPAAVLAQLEQLLDDEERQRADALPTQCARRRYVAAHAVARLVVAGRLGAPPEALRWRRGRHGKPQLTGAWTGLQVNLSHSGDLAVVAVTDRRPVGVDIQQVAGQLDAVRLAQRYFPDREAQFVAAARGAARQVDRYVRLWVRKEACVKAVGGRLLPGLAVPVQGGPPVLVSDPAGALPGRFRVRDLPVPRGFRAAVALAGERQYRVTHHRWSPPER